MFMITWLVDNPALAYIVLATVAIVLMVACWRTQQAKYLVGAGVAFVLILGVWLLSTYVPTDSKRIQSAIEEMSAGVRSRDLDRIFAHVAGDFRHGGLDREAFRKAADQAIRGHDVTNVLAWDFEPGEISREKGTAQMTFLVKPEGAWGTPAQYYRCVAQFVRDPDGQWRMKGFELFDPLTRSRDPVAIPGVR
jgi:ketosteroid isomerase-like protein